MATTPSRNGAGRAGAWSRISPGIAEHKPQFIQAHGIDEAQLRAQVRDSKLNKTFTEFRLFAGVECTSLRDGLARF